VSGLLELLASIDCGNNDGNILGGGVRRVLRKRNRTIREGRSNADSVPEIAVESVEVGCLCERLTIPMNGLTQ